MTGRGEYDLLGPSAFMTAGMPRRVRSLFEGFGYSAADINSRSEAAADGADAAASASDPVRHICIEGWQQKAADLHRIAGFALAGLSRRTAMERSKYLHI